MRTMLMSIVATGGLALGSLAFAPAASAMPATGLSAIPLPLATADRPETILVSGGCGPFRHRGFNGFCHPNRVFGYGYRRPYGYYHPYGYGYRRHFFF